MALTALQLTLQLGYTLDTPVAGFEDSVLGPGSKTYSATLNTTAPIFNLLLAANYSIPAGGLQNFDLTSFTDLQGNPATMAANGVLGIVLLPGMGDIQIGPGATQPLQWKGATFPTITVAAGGEFSLGLNPAGPGQSVTSTNRVLTLTNNGAAVASGYFFVVGG